MQAEIDTMELILGAPGANIKKKKKIPQKTNQDIEQKKDVSEDVNFYDLASKDIAKTNDAPEQNSEWLPDHFKKLQMRSQDGMPMVETKNGECHYHLEGNKRLIEKEDRLQIHGKLDKKDFQALAESLFTKGWTPANVEGEDGFVKEMVKAMAEHAPPIPIAKETLTPELFDEWEKHRELRYGSQYQEYARKMYDVKDGFEVNIENMLSKGSSSEVVARDIQTNNQRTEANEKAYEYDGPVNIDVAKEAIRNHLAKLENLRHEEDPIKIAEMKMLANIESAARIKTSSNSLDTISKQIEAVDKEIQANKLTQSRLISGVERFKHGRRALNIITGGKNKKIKTTVDLEKTRSNLVKKQTVFSTQNRQANETREREFKEATHNAKKQALENHAKNMELNKQVKLAKDVQSLISKRHAGAIDTISRANPNDLQKSVERVLNERRAQKENESPIQITKKRQEAAIER